MTKAIALAVKVRDWLLWLWRKEPVQPVYDANVRQSPWPDRLFVGICITLAVCWITANALRIFIVF